jgi:hypothetical protein
MRIIRITIRIWVGMELAYVNILTYPQRDIAFRMSLTYSYYNSLINQEVRECPTKTGT